jgi:hypothetical protein
MKEIVTASRFIEAFRQTRPEQFSRKALVALFDYLGELEREAAEETELDVIALCTEWTEYVSAEEAAEAYGWEAKQTEDERADTSDRDALQFLMEETQVVEFEGGVLVLNF